MYIKEKMNLMIGKGTKTYLLTKIIFNYTKETEIHISTQTKTQTHTLYIRNCVCNGWACVCIKVSFKVTIFCKQTFFSFQFPRHMFLVKFASNQFPSEILTEIHQLEVSKEL